MSETHPLLYRVHSTGAGIDGLTTVKMVPHERPGGALLCLVYPESVEHYPIGSVHDMAWLNAHLEVLASGRPLE